MNSPTVSLKDGLCFGPSAELTPLWPVITLPLNELPETDKFPQNSQRTNLQLPHKIALS